MVLSFCHAPSPPSSIVGYSIFNISVYQAQLRFSLGLAAEYDSTPRADDLYDPNSHSSLSRSTRHGRSVPDLVWSLAHVAGWGQIRSCATSHNGS